MMSRVLILERASFPGVLSHPSPADGISIIRR